MGTQVTRRLWVLAAPAVLAAVAGSARGQIAATWLNTASDNWFTGAAWSTNPVVPNNFGANTYDALIGPGIVGTSPFTVGLDQPATIESLTLTEVFTTLDLQTNTLTLNQDLTINQATLTANPHLGGGTLDLAGDAFLTESWMIGVTFRTSPTSQVIYNTGAGMLDYICDADVDHRGRLRYTGAGGMMMDGFSTITMQTGATFEIESASANIFAVAGTSSIVNNGEILQTTPGANATISGITLTNNGVLEVSEGTFSTDGVALVGGELDIGTWRVSNGASLDLQGTAILTNNATIEIDGATTTFAALAGLSTIETLGTNRFTGGADFTTLDSFTNNGVLEVGAGSEFTVDPGSTLTNFNGGSLTDGAFTVGGVLRFDNADITMLNTDVTLDGATAQIVDQSGQDGLRNLDTIDAEGDLTLRNGADVTTSGDLTVATTGRLAVGLSSTFTVPTGSTVTNFSGGTFTGGVFDIQGTLVIDASVETLDGEFTLDGPVSTIVKPGGGDVFENLNLIDADGALTLRNGRSLSVLGNVTVNGRLTVESGPPDAPSVLTVPLDLFQAAGVTDLRNGGVVRVGTGGPGAYRLSGGTLRGSGGIEGDLIQTGGTIEPGNSAGTLSVGGDWTIGGTGVLKIELGGAGAGMFDVIDVAGQVLFGSQAQPVGGSLLVTLIDGYVPSIAGDSFEIIRGEGLFGTFAQTQGPIVGGNTAYQVWYSGTSVWVTVYAVPAPAGGLLALCGVAMAGRRRRR